MTYHEIEIPWEKICKLASKEISPAQVIDVGISHHHHKDFLIITWENKGKMKNKDQIIADLKSELSRRDKACKEELKEFARTREDLLRALNKIGFIIDTIGYPFKTGK